MLGKTDSEICEISGILGFGIGNVAQGIRLESGIQVPLTRRNL